MVIQAVLQKTVAQNTVVITMQQRSIRVKKDIIPITALTKVKKEAAAKATIRIIIMKKAVMKEVVMTKLTNMDHIMKAVKDRRVESMGTKKDTRRVPKPLDIITSPVKMTTTRNTNSTMMQTKKEVIISMAATTLITHPKEVKAKRADIMNLDTKETVSAKRVTLPKVIMMTIIKDTRDITVTKVTSPIMTTLARKEVHQVAQNMDLARVVDTEVAEEVVDTEAEVRSFNAIAIKFSEILRSSQF